MDTPKIKQNEERKRKKRKNEGINRRKDTLIKKAYEKAESNRVAGDRGGSFALADMGFLQWSPSSEFRWW